LNLRKTADVEGIADLKITPDRLEKIFDRTDGNCHICGKGICFKNYGQIGARGAWEIEHSIPRCKGGSDCLNNLYGAHIRCNRAKQHRTTRTARSWYGRTKAPMSAQKKQAVSCGRAWGLGVLGAMLGAATGGVGPALLLAATGAAIGKSINPEG
jgi:hypothetical protein